MPSIDRILAAYEQGLKKLADDLVAAEQVLAAKTARSLMLLARMLQAVVSTYEAHQLDQASSPAGRPDSVTGADDAPGAAGPQRLAAHGWWTTTS